MGIKKRGKIWRWGILIGFVIAMVFTTVGSLAVWASGGAGGDDTTTGATKGCYKDKTEAWRSTRSRWNDSCYGTTWHLHSTGSGKECDSTYSCKDQPIIDKIHTDCEPYGGTYYRLGYEIFNTFYSSDELKYTATGYQQGFKQVREVVNGGGSIRFRQDVGLAWSDVEGKFKIAKDIYKNDPHASGNLKNLE